VFLTINQPDTKYNANHNHNGNPNPSLTKAKTKAYTTDIAPQAAILCHKQNRRTAYRPQAKLAPANFDLQTNFHTQPWSVV